MQRWNLLACIGSPVERAGGQFEILLVNAQHIKAVPGRKTGQKDSEWIADLLQHRLLRGSFVPPRETREMRDLTRYRLSLAEECNPIANRISKSSRVCQYQAGFPKDRYLRRLRARQGRLLIRGC
jgi:hypothetical protein